MSGTEAMVPADVIERVKQQVQIIREQDTYSKQVGHATQLGLLIEQHADAILALLATDRAAGVGEVEDIEERVLHIRLTDDRQHIRKWDRKPFDGSRAYYPARLAASPPAPADASDFSPHRWTEIVSNGLGANNAGCWRCGALSEVLARVLSLSGHDAKVIQGKANGEDHVWVQIGDTVYDPTVGQFQEPVSYQMDQVAPADASGEVQSDSADYEHTFYGIINGQGEFWSPLPFHDEATARARLERYAQGPNASMLDTHKIVPVRIVLTALDPKRQEPRP